MARASARSFRPRASIPPARAGASPALGAREAERPPRSHSPAKALRAVRPAPAPPSPRTAAKPTPRPHFRARAPPSRRAGSPDARREAVATRRWSWVAEPKRRQVPPLRTAAILGPQEGAAAGTGRSCRREAAAPWVLTWPPRTAATPGPREGVAEETGRSCRPREAAPRAQAARAPAPPRRASGSGASPLHRGPAGSCRCRGEAGAEPGRQNGTSGSGR